MLFEIKPYIGVGDLKFGMRPDEVADIIGYPEITTENYIKEKVEYRNKSELSVVYSQNDDLIELGFSDGINNLRFKTIDFFSDHSKEVADRIIKEDGNPFESPGGTIVLLRIGITLCGFFSENLSDRAVSVFASGRWDSKIKKFKNFTGWK